MTLFLQVDTMIAVFVEVGEKMKALSLTVEKKLELVEIPTPQPNAGEVLVGIKSAALNHREIWISKGMYPGMTLPRKEIKIEKWFNNHCWEGLNKHIFPIIFI